AAAYRHLVEQHPAACYHADEADQKHPHAAVRSACTTHAVIRCDAAVAAMRASWRAIVENAIAPRRRVGIDAARIGPQLAGESSSGSFASAASTFFSAVRAES